MTDNLINRPLGRLLQGDVQSDRAQIHVVLLRFLGVLRDDRRVVSGELLHAGKDRVPTFGQCLGRQLA